MEPIRGSETSAIKTQTPGNYPKRNILQLKQGESLKTTLFINSPVSGGAPNDVLRNLRVPRNPSWETRHRVMEKLTDLISFFLTYHCLERYRITYMPYK